MVVYLDRVLVLNLIIDYLLLLISAELCGRTLRRCRFFFCALIGAVYAAIVFLPTLHYLSHPLLRCCIGFLMTFAAYGGERRWWRLSAVFFLLSAGLAGVLLALGLMAGSPFGTLERVYMADITWVVLIGATLLFLALIRLFFGQAGRHERGELMKVTVVLGEKRHGLCALQDTGNTLRDPVKGTPVLVVEQAAIEWPTEVNNILQSSKLPEEKMALLHTSGSPLHFLLLPYKAIGTTSGLLLAVRSDYIVVDGQRHNKALVALWEGEISDGGGYQALWPGTEVTKQHVAKNQKTFHSSAEKVG